MLFMCFFDNNLYSSEHSRFGTTIHYNFDELSDDQCALVAEKCRNEASNSRFKAVILGAGIAAGAVALFYLVAIVSVVAAVIMEEMLWEGSLLGLMAPTLGLMGLGAAAAKVLPNLASQVFGQMKWYSNHADNMNEQAHEAEFYASPTGVELLRA